MHFLEQIEYNLTYGLNNKQLSKEFMILYGIGKKILFDILNRMQHKHFKFKKNRMRIKFPMPTKLKISENRY